MPPVSGRSAWSRAGCNPHSCRQRAPPRSSSICHCPSPPAGANRCPPRPWRWPGSRPKPRRRWPPSMRLDLPIDMRYEVDVLQARAWAWAAGGDMGTARQTLEDAIDLGKRIGRPSWRHQSAPRIGSDGPGPGGGRGYGETGVEGGRPADGRTPRLRHGRRREGQSGAHSRRRASSKNWERSSTQPKHSGSQPSTCGETGRAGTRRRRNSRPPGFWRGARAR